MYYCVCLSGMWSQSQCLDLDVLSRHIKVLVSWSCLGRIDEHFGLGIEVLGISVGLTQLDLVHIHSSSSSSSGGLVVVVVVTVFQVTVLVALH